MSGNNALEPSCNNALEPGDGNALGSGNRYTWGLSTSTKSTEAQVGAAKRLAEEYRVPYLPREEFSLSALQAAHGLDYLLTLDRNMRLSMKNPPLHWHPSMALPRLRRLAAGEKDFFLSAAAAEKGDKFLDCTLGLAADTLLAAAAVGETGEVLGLEAAPLIALLTAWGLGHEARLYDSGKVRLSRLAGRIAIRAEEALSFLRGEAEASWDIVYFDPMFQQANLRSSGLNSLRPFACHAPFRRNVLDEALRVCRKRVLLKERVFSPIFQQLNAGRVMRTRYGPVAYGVWEKGESARKPAECGRTNRE